MSKELEILRKENKDFKEKVKVNSNIQSEIISFNSGLDKSQKTCLNIESTRKKRSNTPKKNLKFLIKLDRNDKRSSNTSF